MALIAAVAATAARPQRPAALLPDLDQRPPTKLRVAALGTSVRLGFASNVENLGRGRLMVVGRRATATSPVMRADQLVQLRGGTRRRVTGVGRIHYDVEATHSHWHLLPFERYELRKLDGRLVAPAQKAGFCLTSDHRVRPHVRGSPPRAEFSGHCGKNFPDASRIVEGISVGYGDVYSPMREGQYVDVTDVPPGDYVLVHRVNAGRRLRESDYANDAASVRIRFRGVDSPGPRVSILKVCETGADC